ncbi:CD276 antigen-like [Rhincodon typus]|uniref:CD276 antigen-like n=1 Tax=Rhincodon typus TaxID=259920 RepID=UPI00203083C0|nr:CD276 antigen-like [Rhincodon typus]XP_048450385.1 CD276 antigen-like [Rhincodon typus]
MKSDQSILRTLLGIFLTIGYSSAVVEFNVHTPDTLVTAVYGHSVVLRCNFTVQHGSPSLERLVINWQRVETEEVVYSYYYGKEQLSHQSSQYSGRTSLFMEELKRGNASLKLSQVKPEDAGQYKCFVSDAIGSGWGTMSVMFAAYYKEPDFYIQLRPSGTVFRFESQGYPKAFVSWHNEDNEDISAQSETYYQQSDNGLYSLRSILEITDTNRSLNYTFKLTNNVLHQSVSRTFGLSVGKLTLYPTRLVLPTSHLFL